MDIVDTFNHLIPTEHLDDALFLGSNLENEVCEDFSTSQNVLEDSLKNMLSDKDPMLGSASAQFCLPVLDSTDPNFQMPCSTAVGLDDIMDDRVKETAHSTIDEGDLSSNRKLRDQMDGTSAKSPRKSPRLMNQEPVRSLRQSTLAKRSNSSSSVPAKKTVKSGPAQKGGLKQHDKGQAKQDNNNNNAPEQLKKIEPSNDSSQLEETKEIPPSSSGNSEWVPSCAETESTEADNEHEIPTEPKVKVCHETGNSSNLPDSITLCKEMENGAQAVTENYGATIGTESVSSAFVEADKVTYSNSLKDEGDEVMKYTSEISSSEKANHKTEEEQNRTEIEDQNKETGTNDTLLISKTCENSSEIQEDLLVQSNFVDRKAECNLTLKASDDIAHNANLQKEDKQECSDDLVNSMEFEQADLKEDGTNSIKLEASTLEDNIIQDIPTETVYQEPESVKIGELEISGLQEDRHSGVPLKCLKKTKSKNTKTKQNKTIVTQQRLATVGHDTPSKIHVLPSPRSQFSVSLKRHMEEQGNIQHCQKIIKVKKQHSDKDIRFQSCDSGIPLKKQIHEVGKNISRGQIPVQVRKIMTEKMNDRSVSHHAGSKEGLHLALGTANFKQGQLPQQSPKQPQKYHLKTNNCIKEEGGKKDSMALFVDYLKDDEKEKMKVRKLEKNLQPRQRRSSKSLSVDEPPLFIPDNISTVKRESTELLSPSESKSIWIPSKQCGFCRKPHGNRFMVGCGRCDDWFHGDCVGLSLFQAQQMGEEDKEYVCIKCCAEEDKKPDSVDQNMLDANVKLETARDNRSVESEKPGISKQTLMGPQNKTPKQGEDSLKYKVKIFKRESSEGKAVLECKDSESKKGQQIPLKKTGQMGSIPRRSSDEKYEKLNKDNTSCSSESTPKQGIQEKQEMKKKRTEKGTASNVHSSPASAPKPSADQIRQSVKQSLKEILEKRLADSTLKIPEERAAKVANKIEKELFSFFRDTDSKYKNKYRSLIFNLKDPKNKILFKRVLKGEVTPDHLIRMSPEELASKELAAWRKRENRHTIEMIEKEQREVERRPITKITHKGEIEIESETPVKEQEATIMEIQEPVPIKIVEKVEETEKVKEANDSSSSDTTNQHKNHLFDLNCKICTGRMAPPSDDLAGKKVKVSVGVARKPSDNEADNIADALTSTTNILALELLEEDKELSDPGLASTSSSRSETAGTVESETLFLAHLNFIWKGFINMPSVAKFVIKAYPISGSFESLTEDLPDSIQVGGRISPQTVWEYVDKIKASGTKEICVVRFTPVTEEDQISYTLLFAYFSSRKRYGVAANNMKQIKDLYIIPLGASDKIPHQLVPFDGPGIEVHRPNLLLGLIIRQKLKRQISAVANSTMTHAEEGPENLQPEKKSKPNKLEVLHPEVNEKEEENDFFNSFTTVLHKQRIKSQQCSTEEVTTNEPAVESIKLEPPKPLRFLPGVLVGWENQSSALELASKPLPVDDILQSLLDTTGQMPEHIQPTVDKLVNKDLPLLEKRTNVKEENIDIPVGVEVKRHKKDNAKETINNTLAVDVSVDFPCSSGTLTSLSLKEKPPDVSTEVFLANLTILSQNKENQETPENSLKLGDTDNVPQENKRTIDFPVTSNAGKGVGSNNVGTASVDTMTIHSSKSPPFINLKRDPRQAAGRGQQNNSSESEGDSTRSEDMQQLDTLESEQSKVDNKQTSGNELASDETDNQACKTTLVSNASNGEGGCTSQLKDTLMQNIETENTERGLLPPPPPPPPPPSSSTSLSSQFEAGNTSHQSDFSTKLLAASGNFSPIRTPQPNFPPTKTTPPGFQFQGAIAPNFSPPNTPVFGFPHHLPPPLLPPPGFGFAQSPLMPWPPVLHLPGQLPHYVGPVTPAPPPTQKPSRFSGPEHFYQNKNTRRHERRHSDPWAGRQGPHVERAFSRRKNDQHRQRFYSESHHPKKGRHDWELDPERSRHRDRSSEKERERKNREEGHRDKERLRLSHSDKDSESKSSQESRNSEKKDVPRSEERFREKEKEREKSRERPKEQDNEKNRERHHKDRDQSDRGKSKR
ncbi:PHD finger protein 3 isoform X1 [Pantherophis guttatus]|uniref:PHD finger protein 3 isoform X1 n=3 Tax=Pantherophis guttatus TaxID=94885 RepID=A0A6P9D8Q7_PANGU|nr:PHD finger protein 3 isoform X1 [Pantherophis guttatus]XP_034292567.1 PHD finger protein 3 isoform X1 [Pantherophis guttatus]XP_034292568.1 PHD finger protein 3 isoform X1 [Pantherophis guttatus]